MERPSMQPSFRWTWPHSSRNHDMHVKYSYILEGIVHGVYRGMTKSSNLAISHYISAKWSDRFLYCFRSIISTSQDMSRVLFLGNQHLLCNNSHSISWSAGTACTSWSCHPKTTPVSYSQCVCVCLSVPAGKSSKRF